MEEGAGGAGMTPAQFLSAILLAMVISGVGTWQIQDWRMGEKLAEQAGLHKDDLAAISNAAAAQASVEQNKRLALEQQLAGQDQQHAKELSDVQRNQARLRDQLATADVRLSVLLSEDSASGCNLPATCLPPPAPSAWFMQPVEPNLTQRMLNELSESPIAATKD